MGKAKKDRARARAQLKAQHSAEDQVRADEVRAELEERYYAVHTLEVLKRVDDWAEDLFGVLCCNMAPGNRERLDELLGERRLWELLNLVRFVVGACSPEAIQQLMDNVVLPGVERAAKDRADAQEARGKQEEILEPEQEQQEQAEDGGSESILDAGPDGDSS